MKKLIIIFVCLLLLVSCKNSEEGKNETTKKEEVKVYVHSDDGNWTNIEETLIDSLNNKEIINEYAMSVPTWDVERGEEYIIYKNEGIAVVLLYSNEHYTNKDISNYNKSNSKKVNINSFDTEYEEGSVTYNGKHGKYISYYIDNNEFTLKLIGLSENNGIHELNDMIKSMIESLEKEIN